MCPSRVGYMSELAKVYWCFTSHLPEVSFDLEVGGGFIRSVCEV